jgi:hypothetical protein
MISVGKLLPVASIMINCMIMVPPEYLRTDPGVVSTRTGGEFAGFAPLSICTADGVGWLSS